MNKPKRKEGSCLYEKMVVRIRDIRLTHLNRM